MVIVHGDAGHRGRRSRRRAAATIIRLGRRLLRRKITTRYETLYTGGALGPPEANNVQGIDDVGPCADADRADWSGSCGHSRFAQTAFWRPKKWIMRASIRCLLYGPAVFMKYGSGLLAGYCVNLLIVAQ